MVTINPVRGTKDLLPQEKKIHNKIITTSRNISELYGYLDVQTPIFESSEVFSKPLGESSDVVSKETYNFNDRNDDLLTLRPEGTASIMRAVLSNSLTQNLPIRWFYSGPMFRYERPQKGRLRQFHQIGCELIGSHSYLSDIEIILCSYRVLNSLSVLDHCNLKLNTLGDTESRKLYRRKLVEYLQSNKKYLSADSKNRINSNPLRVLDSKDENDKEIILKAPKLYDNLNLNSKRHYDNVRNSLEKMGIKYIDSPFLVRGLDYYTHTVFEFVTNKLGAQGTVLGGGRYDGLCETLGGPYIPGVGFSAGVERLALLLSSSIDQMNIDVGLISLDEIYNKEILEIAEKIRDNNIPLTIINDGSNISKKMKLANKIGCRFVIICGSNEIEKKELVVKNMDDGSQKNVKIEDLSNELKLSLRRHNDL